MTWYGRFKAWYGYFKLELLWHLSIAYQKKIIKGNVNDFLEKIETDVVRKEFLISEELKKLAATPCDIPVLKQASLFSCLTGLRISDILNLAWNDIQLAPELGYCFRIRIKKTDTETMLPICIGKLG